MAELRRFATAVVATYLASTDRISVCNAGHPRPLFRRATDGEWSLLAPVASDEAQSGNLPLGLDDETRYRMFDVVLGRGDLLMFYTDALIEAADSEGRLLGESGLLEKAQPARPDRPEPGRDRSRPAGSGRELSGAPSGGRRRDPDRDPP